MQKLFLIKKPVENQEYMPIKVIIFYEIDTNRNHTNYYGWFSKTLCKINSIFFMYRGIEETYCPVRINDFFRAVHWRKNEYIWLSNLFLVFCDKPVHICNKFSVSLCICCIYLLNLSLVVSKNKHLLLCIHNNVRIEMSSHHQKICCDG